jgi:hypothetical protein
MLNKSQYFPDKYGVSKNKWNASETMVCNLFPVSS